MKNISNQTLKVNEIFYTLQGEGARAGQASIFIRLAECNLKCNFCDTEYITYTEMTLQNITQVIGQYPCNWIVWTGGEPCLQLTDSIVEYFSWISYMQAIETNGTLLIPKGLDHVVISPKSGNTNLFKALSDNYGYNVLELRYVFKTGYKPPKISDIPLAQHYYLSPLFLEEDKTEVNQELLQECIDYCLKNATWKLSVQQHKLWKIK